MLLENLSENPFYTQICDIVSDKISLEGLQVFLTHNTFYKSTCERIVQDDWTESEVQLALDITEEEYRNSTCTNIIKVVSDDTTLDVYVMNYNSKNAVFITFYKVVE